MEGKYPLNIFIEPDKFFITFYPVVMSNYLFFYMTFHVIKLIQIPLYPLGSEILRQQPSHSPDQNGPGGNLYSKAEFDLFEPENTE